MSSPTNASGASDLSVFCPQLHGSAPTGGEKAYCPQFVDTIPWPGSVRPIVLCWNYTEAGTEAVQPCPQVAGWNPTAFATKRCLDDATWMLHPFFNRSFVNLIPCLKTGSSQNYVVYVYWAGYSISILALTISLIIFRAFRQLQCDRLTLHKHLFSCYLLNAAVWIVFYLIMGHTDAMKEDWTSCKVLHLICSYFSVATYMWMFCEGFYLVVILVVTFIQNTKTILKFCIAIGWGLPLLLTIVYGATRWGLAYEEAGICWTAFSNLLYILQVPIIVSLSLNIVFVVIIIIVLIMKLRSPVSPDQQQGRKAAKAIVILVPLLGIQYIFTLVKAEEGVAMKAHEYIVAVFVSFQGLMVAVLFCFLNQEVHSAVGRRISRRRYTAYEESTAMSRRISRVTTTSRCDRHDLDNSTAGANANANKLLKPPVSS